MNLTPLHDRIIVQRHEPETQSAGGIFLPDMAADKPDQGEVLAIGPGKRNDKGEHMALVVKPGDMVIFGKHSGQTIRIDGRDYLAMREEDVFAVMGEQA